MGGESLWELVRMAALERQLSPPQKKPSIGDDAKAWVVHIACSKPKELGYATAEVWSRRGRWQNISESMPWKPDFPRCLSGG